MFQNFPKVGSALALISTADRRSPGPDGCVTAPGAVSPCWWLEFAGVDTLLLIMVDLAAPLGAPDILDLLFSAVLMTIPGSAAPAVGIESRGVG